MSKIPPQDRGSRSCAVVTEIELWKNGVAGRVFFAMQGPETRKLDPGDESSVNLGTCATQTSFQCTKNLYHQAATL